MERDQSPVRKTGFPLPAETLERIETEQKRLHEDIIKTQKEFIEVVLKNTTAKKIVFVLDSPLNVSVVFDLLSCGWSAKKDTGSGWDQAPTQSSRSSYRYNLKAKKHYSPPPDLPQLPKLKGDALVKAILDIDQGLNELPKIISRFLQSSSKELNASEKQPSVLDFMDNCGYSFIKSERGNYVMNSKQFQEIADILTSGQYEKLRSLINDSK